MSELLTAIVVVLLMAGSACVGYFAGHNAGECDFAIEHGLAEWRIDPNTGDRSFHWIDNNESERE